MIDTFMLSSAFFIVGGGIGVIAGGLFAGAKLGGEVEDLRRVSEARGRALDNAADNLMKKGRQLAEARALIFGYEATERARTSGLRAHNAARHAEKLAQDALKEANHNSMRATLEMVG